MTAITSTSNHYSLMLNDADQRGSLKAELEGLAQTMMGGTTKEIQDVIFDTMKQWKASKVLQEALKEGDIAPDFLLPDQDGNLISSVDLRAKGPIIVIFFRGDWCAFCNTMLRMVRKYTPHFKARGATVVAISPQNMAHSKQTQKDAGLTFPVLSDRSNEYAQLLNIAFVLDDPLKKIYQGAGVVFGSHNGETGDGEVVLPIPATYVIETDGHVTYSFIDTDHTKRAEPVDLLNALPRLKSQYRRRSLSEKIEMEMGKLWDSYPEQNMKTLFEEVARLKASGIEKNALRVGEKAPDFKLASRNGSIIDSKKLRKQGPLVVTFNFGYKSPLCMLQLEALQRHLSKFEAKGASVVAISPYHGQSSNLNQISAYTGAKFPLLTDTDNDKIAKQFGLMHSLPGQLVGDEDLLDLPMAATYIIDRSGYIVYSFVNVDPTKRAEPAVVLKHIPTKFQRRAAVKHGPFSLLFGRRLTPRLRQVQTRE